MRADGPPTAAAPAVAPRRPRALHPWLFAAYPVVALYAGNLQWAVTADLVVPLALGALATSLAWVAARLVLRDGARAGLLTSLAVFVFFTIAGVGDVVNRAIAQTMSTLWVYRGARLDAAVCMGAEAALALAVAALALVRPRDPGPLTRYLNVFALLLLAQPVWSALRAGVTETPPVVRAAPGLPLPTPPPPDRPDIYYIVLDGFTRADVLSERFGYDLEPCLKRLEALGFFVARRATSNYAQTPLSLSSSLNAVYLDGLTDPDSVGTGDLAPLIRDGAAVRALRSLGYRVVSYATGFDETENPEADVYKSPYVYIRGFHRMLLAGTPVARFLPNPGAVDSYTMTRERTLYAFDTLPAVADDPAPTFAFVHLLAPHPPFVFGPDGEDVSPRGRTYFLNDGNVYHLYYGGGPGRDYVAGYRGEVAFLARRLVATVAALLARSPRPPIILIQGDHGSGSRLDLNDPDATDLYERMSILSAYYLPSAAPRGQLYDSITPVNSFRVVFNACFAARLPLLPDRSYFSTWGHPFEYIDVTDQVRGTSRPAPHVTE